MAELSAYYYIAPGSLSIVPNANNSPNDIAVSIASSASIMVFAPRIHNDLNWDGTNYRVWRLTAGNTRLGSEHADKIVYIYARLSRSAPTAEIIFTSVRHTANARQEAQTDANGDPILDGDGNEVMQTVYDEQYIKMSSDEASFWVRIGLLTAPDENNRRELEYDSGQLGTPKGDADKNETGLNVMWVYDSTAKVMRAQVPIGAKTQGGEVRFVDPVRIDYTVRFGANGVKLNGVSTSIGDNPNESNITSADDRLIATKGFSFARFIKRAGDTLDAFFNFLGGMKIGKTSGADPALLVEGGTETDTLEVTDNAHIDTLDVENDASVGGDVAVGGRLDVTGDATAANVHAVDADGTYGNVIGKHLAATEDGRTGGDVVGLTVGNFTPSIDGIGGEGGGMIEVTEQLTDDEGNPRVDEQNNPLMGKFSSLDVDYLTVRRRAFFTNITVKELKHVGGEIILSPAAMICYAVEELRDAGATLVGWRCYFKASDTEGRKLHQEFEVGDQARCQMFDIDPGTSKYVSTRYYWRYVRGVSVEAVDLTLERDGESETVKCHYIDLSFSDRDPGCSNVNKSGIPQPGDNISQLGNRSNVERQSAQILSAVGMYAPSHTYYQHINSYSLGSEKIVKQSYYDPTTGRMKDFVGDEHNYMRWTGTSLDIKGNLSTSSGKNVDNVLTEHERQIQGLGVNMSNVNAQADQRFQVWFDYDGIVPTLQNEPAVNWDTVELLTLHNQDIYYSCRILSDNDTPDDPSDDELSADGRAWRFDYTPPAASSSSSSSEEDEGSSSSSSSSSDDDTPSIPGTARWVEITDQFALQGLRNAAIADRKAMTAQETVDNLADDNIISAGAEKSRLLKEWKQAVDEWQKYNLQASDHQTALAAAIAAEADADILSELNAGNTGLTTALSAFNAAWKHLAHYLDGDLDGDAEWDLAWAMDEETGNPVTPRWLNADFTIDTCLGSVNGVDTGLGGAARYREKWNDYYASLTSLIRAIAIAAKAISNRAQATADAALSSIADIVSDGKLTVDELPDLKREFEAAYRQRAEMVDLATYDSGANQYKIIDSSLTSPLEAYLTAFTNLTTYLNMASGAWTEPTTSPTYAVTYANGNTPGSYRVGAKSPLVTADFPALLKVSATTEFKSTWGSGGTADNGAAFRNLWAALATAQVKLANAMATLSKDAADAADQKAQAAQDTVDNLASDRILSAGSEKAKLLVEWMDVVSAYGQYPAQAQDHIEWLSTEGNEGTVRTALQALISEASGATTSTSYVKAVKELGKFLNDGTALTANMLNGTDLPKYISTANGGTYASDTTLTAEQATSYRQLWTDCYATFNALLRQLTKAGKLKTERAQTDATNALSSIADIVSDGKLTVDELPDLKREFEAAYRQRAEMVDLATYDSGANQYKIIDSSLTSPLEAYLTAFTNLTTYLNMASGAWTEPTTSPTYAVTYANGNTPGSYRVGAKSPLVTADFPALLKVSATTEFKSTWGSGGTADNGAAFRNLWAALATAQVKLANAMATLSKNAADAADQKAQAAQDAVDLLADDGTISGGDEKSKLYIEWQRVLNERTQYMEQVDDYTNATTGRLTILASTAKVSSTNRTAASTAKTSLTNLYAAYETAIINLGKYLDGMIANGSYSEGAGDFYNGGTVSWNTLPAIIKDDAARATDTTPISATTYRTRWDTYYTALKDLFTALSDAAMLCVRVSQETGNSALTRIDEILSDGVIDVGEKSEVLADFLNAWNRMHISGGLRDRARDANGNFFPSVTIGGVTYNCSAAYNSWLAAFDALGAYLSGNQWDSRELNPDAQTNLISADDEGLPYEINDGDGGLSETMDVTPSEYRAVWSALYNAETKMETVVAKVTKYIADAAKEGVDNIFSDDILTPEELRVIRREFHAMCVEWMQPGTGLKAQYDSLVATSSDGFEFDGGNYGDVSMLGAFLNEGSGWDLFSISISSPLWKVSEGDTPKWIKTANIETPVYLSTIITTVRSNWEYSASELKESGVWLSGRAALEKLWRLAVVETEYIRKEIEVERAAQAASNAVNTVNTDTSAVLYQLAQSAYNRTGQRCQVFNGSTRPTNYKIGDLWINATTTTAIAIWDPDKSGGAGAVNKKLTGQTMVCWTTGQDSVRSSFTAGDWQELDHYVHSWIKQQSDAIMLGIEATGDEDPETGTLATKFNAIELDINGIKAITENITLDGNGKISQINQSGIVVQSNFATLFSQRMTAEHVATTSQITAAADGIKLEVKADVEEDINPGDNLFQYAELGDISTLIEYWTLRTQGNADAAAATAALYGVSSPIFSVKSATREGWPILEMNMRRSVLTNTTGSPHVDIEQIVPSAVLKATGASSFTVSIYVRRNGDYSDRAFGFFVDNCAGFTTSSGDDPSNVTISQQNVNLSGNLYYTQFYIGDNEWHRLWVTFSVYSINADTKIYFRSWKTRDTSNGSVWYLSCPKLEAGTKPTRWIVERSVIDITKNQIVLDSKTVKVAKDLTIGGNAHIGGFIFNDAVTLTPDKVKVCFNPFDFGLMDRSLAKEGFQHNIPPYLTNNVIFPDFGSSIVIDENVASVFRDPDTVPHRDRLQIMLPFWHFYNVDHNNPMDYPAQIASNVAAWYWTDGTLDTDGVSLKKFYFNTYPDKNTKRLWDFMVNGYSVCLKYIDTVVTIVNALDENDYGDNDVWIFGAKGVVDGEYGFTHYNTLNLGSIVDFFELEPWNRGTIRWSIADYYSGNYSTHRFASSYAWPRLDEAKAIIANDSYRTLDYMSHRVSSGSWHATNRQYDNDTVWINASQLGQEEDFTDIDGTSNDLMAGATLVSGSNCCPFILPKGYFVRLKCVFRDGFFFWEPIDFGAIDTN